jgi:hypothetical protein
MKYTFRSGKWMKLFGMIRAKNIRMMNPCDYFYQKGMGLFHDPFPVFADKIDQEQDHCDGKEHPANYEYKRKSVVCIAGTGVCSVCDDQKQKSQPEGCFHFFIFD